MKKQTLKQLGIFVLVAAMGSPALADPGRDGRRRPPRHYGADSYARNGGRIEMDMRRPGPRSACDVYRRSGEPVEFYSTCRDGEDAAERFAQMFSSRQGRLDGYLRGYGWGFKESVDQAANDRDAQQDGIDDAQYLKNEMQTGLDYETERGARDGMMAGQQEARRRFSVAMGTGTLPSQEVQPPVPNYSGNSNGYDQYVGRVPSIEDVLQQGDYARRGIPIYDRLDDFSSMGRNRYSLRDAWTWRGEYDYRSFGPSAQGFDAFVRSPMGQRYDRLRSVRVTVMEPAPDVVPTPVVQPAPVRPPTPGSPPSVPNHRGAEQPTQGRSDQNQPTPGDRPDRGGRRGGQDQGDNNGRGPSNDSNQRMIAVQKDLNLQEYFRTGFNSAYADAARYFYNVEFQNNIDDGYRAGTEVGSDVGDKVAYMTGQRIGFNRLFLVASGEAYRTSYINSFYDGFQKTYDNYAGRAIVSVSLKRVIESNNNGILEPGEVFATEFTLSNEGGVDADVSISVTGQVSPGAAQVFRIPALQSKVFRADKIGSINGLARSRSQAEINLLASYQGQTLSSSLNQAIFKVVDVVAVRPQIDINRGSGQVVLTLENNSSLRSPGTITARLSLNGVQKDLVAVGVIAANTQAQALVKFSQVDPLDIIAGKIQMGYDVTMNGETLSSVIEPLGAPDVIDAKLSYWDSLWNKQGWAPGGLGEKPKRVARLREEIRVANMQDITSAGRTNIWKSPMQTVVGKAGRHAVAAAANTPLRLAYHSLGVDFYGIRKSIPGGFLGPGNRDDYKDLCNVLAVHGDYDKKPRTPIYAPVFSDY